MTERKEAYLAYLQSAEWQAKREQAFKSKGRKCKACGCEDNLHVHHISYKNLGCERLKELVVLCEACHRLVHQIGKGKKALQSLLDPKKQAARAERKKKREREKLNKKQFVTRMLSGPVKIYSPEELKQFQEG